MTEPLFSVTCGRCFRLLPGGSPEQRPHELRLNDRRAPVKPWEPDDVTAMVELVCLACKEDA